MKKLFFAFSLLGLFFFNSCELIQEAEPQGEFLVEPVAVASGVVGGCMGYTFNAVNYPQNTDETLIVKIQYRKGETEHAEHYLINSEGELFENNSSDPVTVCSDNANGPRVTVLSYPTNTQVVEWETKANPNTICFEAGAYKLFARSLAGSNDNVQFVIKSNEEVGSQGMGGYIATNQTLVSEWVDYVGEDWQQVEDFCGGECRLESETTTVYLRRQ